MEHPLNPGELPPGYREALYWKISGKPARLLAMNLLGIMLFVLAWVLFSWLAATLGQAPANIRTSSITDILLFLAALVLVVVLHELVHGIAMRIFKARPKYGVMWSKMMFYATSPGFAFPRRAYLSVALAPLISLSLLAVLAILLLAGTPWVLLIALAATLNAAGAIGDLWISAVVLRYPAHAYVMDEQDGMRVFLPET
jgi:hypothetical protein